MVRIILKVFAQKTVTCVLIAMLHLPMAAT
jgi:hypothetical protein